MYSTSTIAYKYIHHLLTASNRKGHGVHSPFVFDFITKVLNDKSEKDCYNEIEVIRNQLLKNNSSIEVEDFGAGSSIIKSNTRQIHKIAASSLKSKKFAQLLHRIVAYYQPKTCIELGTSLGTTTAYIAKANPNAKVVSFEGSNQIADIAQNNFEQLCINNIELIRGDFEKTLPVFIKRNAAIDFVFIDGNHRKKPTIAYFEALLNLANEQSIFVFDDIHWSEEMEAAWDFIKNHQSVSLSVDLFFIGIVYFKNDFKEKQHFKIQF